MLTKHFNSNYSLLKFLAPLAVILQPLAFHSQFMIHRISEGGGGTSFEQEQKKLLEKITTDVNDKINEFKKDTITAEQLAKKVSELKEELKGTQNEDFLNDLQKQIQDGIEKRDELLNIIKEQGKDIAALKASGVIDKQNRPSKDFIREIVKTHLEKARLIGDEITNDANNKVRPVNISMTIANADRVKHKLNPKDIIKTGESMYLYGTGTQAVFNQAINRDYIGEIAPPLTANDHALDIFGASATSGTLMTLMIYQNEELNAELVAEGAAPSSDSRIEKTSRDFKVFDFAATATVSKSLMQDSMELIDELATQLYDDLKTTLDEYLFVSTGDNDTAPWGLFNTTYSCTTFNPLLFTGKSPSANLISVMGKAALQARLNNWRTDMIIMNPYEWDEVEDLKDLNENSIKDNRLAVNSLGELIAFKAMRHYQTTKQPQNTMLVCNSTLQVLKLRQDIETAMGYNSDDFKKRKISFVMDMRAGYGQKAKESSIYVDDIADAIAILSESAADSLTRVNGYATGSDATALTVATLTNTGVTDVIESNLASYKTAIAAEAGIANKAALQAVIDAVNAA